MQLRATLALAAVAACKPLPPPPMVAFHGTTEAPARGTVTAMLVVGLAGQLLGGDGFGAAVRVEHARTDHTTLGLELTGGAGSDDEGTRLWLVAVRGFGRTQPAVTRYVAASYGAGLSVMNVGLVTLTLHGGGATSAPNDYLVPFVGAGVAAALPLRRGRSWGKAPAAYTPAPCLGCFEPRPEPAPLPRMGQLGEAGSGDGEPVRAEVFLYLDGGLATSFGGTANQLSFDFALAVPLRADEGGLIGVSFADRHRVRAPE